MTENTRKAVITTAQVTAAFDRYKTALSVIGQDVTEHEFDKGFRGRGFAQYDSNGNVVETFETKEAALLKYEGLAEGMWLVINAAVKGDMNLDVLKVDETESTDDKATAKPRKASA
jgi:hypothetical protein